MSHYTAFFDANVIYPAPVRDILVELAVMDLFRAKWSADIHREWIEALLRNEPHRDRAVLETDAGSDERKYAGLPCDGLREVDPGAGAARS